jgi:predicted ATP-grasp superfamily ATP-dependent carboligase
MKSPIVDFTNSPPCIVLGLETQIGLALVRELGSYGIRVIGIGHSANGIAGYSRYLWKRLVVLTPRSSELLETLVALGEEFGKCCLMTVSEANLSWLIENCDRLGNVIPVVPTKEAFSAVLDKQQTIAAAVALGIRVPKTVEFPDLEHTVANAADLPIPGVLKWKDPGAVAADLNSHGLTLKKAEYVYSLTELRDACKPYAVIGKWPLLQEYCPGQGLGQFFFLQKGEVLRRFQHIRVAEWPPEGGFSSVCDALPLAEHVQLQEQSIALLRALHWEGIAMVEYRWNKEKSEAVLMEINGRFWGSYPLAVHCGAGFSIFAYCNALKLPPPLLPAPRDDLRCRMFVTEVKRLVRIFLEPHKIQDRNYRYHRGAELLRFFLDYLHITTRYFVWSLRDPLPWVLDMMQAAKKGLAGVRN